MNGIHAFMNEYEYYAVFYYEEYGLISMRSYIKANSRCLG